MRKRIIFALVVALAAVASAAHAQVVPKLDTDDGSIATGQATGLVLPLNQVYDGSVWRRLTFGTAGTASAQVWTVQGIASMVALKVDPSAVTSPVSVASLPGLGAGVNYLGKVATWADGTFASGVTAAMTSTTSTSVIAGTASNYVYVGSCSVNNTHASVDTLVNLQDGSSGPTLWTFTAPHNYGGESHVFTPPLKVTTSGNGLFAADVTTGASVIIACQGFKSTTSF